MVLVYPPPPTSSERRAPPPGPDYSTAYRALVRAARGAKMVGLRRTATPLHATDEGDAWLDPASARLGAAATAVLLLVAADVDALCAARTLAHLLTDDDIPFRIVPVEGYANLQNVLEQHVVGNESLRTVVFINLGSVLSLSTYFRTAQPASTSAAAEALGQGRSDYSTRGPEDFDARSTLSEEEEEEETRLPLPPLCTVHVIDSHRPWNLDSLFATSDIMERICIWDDGGVADLAAETEAYDQLEFDDGLDSGSESESRSDSEPESDEEDDPELEGRPRKRIRVDSQGNPIPHKPKPKRLTDHARALYQSVLTRYYERGTTMGRSVAAMLWMLAETLGRVDNEILW